ncbi:hypothetical protein [Caballeronia sordidicola]|nr:hypothetical protein [Caballeronia sordidicola]
MIATICLARENVAPLLCVALAPVARAMIDLAIERGQPTAEMLKILSAQFIERQQLNARVDGKYGRHRVGRA